MSKTYKSITVPLTEEQRKVVDDWAKKERLKASSLIRKLVLDHIEFMRGIDNDNND